MSDDVFDFDLNNSLLVLAADIVTAYVSNNTIDSKELPDIIRSVHTTLTDIHADSDITNNTLKPAVPIEESFTDDYIICLEDGKKLKMLKRYLRSRYGLSPEEYRAKWGLPMDYPMVAPSYAAKRSEFAKKIGLGKRD